MNWLRFGKPWRGWLLKLCGVLPLKLSGALLRWLYPDDCEITFE